MMLQVEEHLEGDPVFYLPVQGACERSQSWCTVHTAKKEVMHWPIAITPTWYQSAKPPESAKTKYTQRTPAASSARIQRRCRRRPSRKPRTCSRTSKKQLRVKIVTKSRRLAIRRTV